MEQGGGAQTSMNSESSDMGISPSSDWVLLRMVVNLRYIIGDRQSLKMAELVEISPAVCASFSVEDDIISGLIDV